MTTRPLTLFHRPQTRSTGVLTLLQELAVPYTLHVLEEGGTQSPAFLAVNPLGKVPALLDGDAVVTEQVAIMLHLADLFPAAGLAPPLADPLRGPYLRWMLFYAAAFEPALVDRARGYEPGNRAMSPYGSFDAVIDMLEAALVPGPFILGPVFSAADIVWGTALGWTLRFKLVPERPVLVEYAARIAARPSAQWVRAKDAELAGC